MPYGYEHGNPFGDPNRFTRSTQESEIDRFNQWMRSQPWWQQIRGNTRGDFTDGEKQQLQAALAAQGIQIPGDFHIDEGGNFNQRSRTARNIGIGLAIGGGALTGLGLLGLGPLSGLGGSAAAAGGLSEAAIPTTLGTTGIPGAAGGLSAAGAAATGGRSLLSRVMSPDALGAIGTGASAYAQAAASNRGTALEATQNQDQLRLAAAADQRTAESDAWRKLLHASNVLNYQPPTRPSYLPETGLMALPAPSAAMRQGATTLEQEMLKRLRNPGVPLSDVDQYMNPGTGEQLSGALGAGLSVLPFLSRR